jgi:hypothetical protein
MKTVVNTNRKNNKIIQFVHILKALNVEHHVLSRRSRIVLQLRLHQKDAAPCDTGSGSATLLPNMQFL